MPAGEPPVCQPGQDAGQRWGKGRSTPLPKQQGIDLAVRADCPRLMAGNDYQSHRTPRPGPAHRQADPEGLDPGPDGIAGNQHGGDGRDISALPSRALIAALVREAAHGGLCGCGLTGGKFCGANDAGDRCPGWPAGQERGNFADRCPLVATGCQLADLVDYVVSAVPPTGFRAVLEADALAQETSRALAAKLLAGRADNLEKEASKS